MQSGLFKGTALYPRSLSSQLLPKIFGTYEAEVQDLINRKIKGISGFVDIGCAEGFYVAGIAAKFGIKSTGVDIDPESSAAIRYLAKANKLQEKIEFESDTSKAIQSHKGRLMILVDVDGNEEKVIRDLDHAVKMNTELEGSVVIVETDFNSETQNSNASELIKLLASLGWNILELLQQDPRLRFSPKNRDLSFLDQVTLGAEGRAGGQSWICAER